MKQAIKYVVTALILIGAACSQDTEQLIKDLENDSSTARRKAASKLSIMKKDKETVAKIAALLDSDNDRTVLIATQLLGTTDSTMVKTLGRMIRHPNANIRDRAVEAIGLIGYSEAAPYLIEALEDSSEMVRHSAVRMLGAIGNPSVVPALFPMLRDEADSIRTQTVQSLYMYHMNTDADIRAADFAVAMNDPSDVVRYVTAQALGAEYPDRDIAGELLIEALKDRNKYVRIEAITSIAKIKYDPAVQHLKDMFDLATVDEELEITEAIRLITGEEFPPPDY